MLLLTRLALCTNGYAASSPRFARFAYREKSFAARSFFFRKDFRGLRHFGRKRPPAFQAERSILYEISPARVNNFFYEFSKHFFSAFSDGGSAAIFNFSYYII